MMHLVVRVPIQDISEQASTLVYGTALSQSILSLKLGKKNILVQELSLALMTATIRVLTNARLLN